MSRDACVVATGAAPPQDAELGVFIDVGVDEGGAGCDGGGAHVESASTLGSASLCRRAWSLAKPCSLANLTAPSGRRRAWRASTKQVASGLLPLHHLDDDAVDELSRHHRQRIRCPPGPPAGGEPWRRKLSAARSHS